MPQGVPSNSTQPTQWSPEKQYLMDTGQRILVPRRDVVAAARDVPNPNIERYGASSTYTVRRGDNLGAIARRRRRAKAQAQG